MRSPRENARANEVAPLIRAAVADGLTHPAIASLAPFDLILANILAAPLTQLAPNLSAALAPRGLPCFPACCAIRRTSS